MGERKSPVCYFCEVPLRDEIEYKIRQIRPMETFLSINPQWLSFGKDFGKSTTLCNQQYCLAAAFENWRLDSFGVKSPRSPRGRKNPLPSKKTPSLPFSSVDLSVENEMNHGDTTATESKRIISDNESSSSSLDKSPSALLLATAEALSTDNRAMNVNNSESSRDEAGKENDVLKLVKEKKELLSLIQDKSYGLDFNAENLSGKLQNNREERLRVARRLQELRDKEPELELKKIQKQKDIIASRKRDIYEQLTLARLERKSIQEKIDSLDLQQKVSIMKLETYNKLDSDEAIVHSDMQNKLKESLEPALSFLDQIPDAKQILEAGIANSEDKDYEQSSTAITQELQHALRESYMKNKEDLLEERRILTAGRFELESRLGQLKELDGLDSENNDTNNDNNNKNGDDDNQYYNTDQVDLMNDNIHAREDDEPFDSVFDLAGNMDDIVHQNIIQLNERIRRGNEEADWVEDYPDTEIWLGLKERVSTYNEKNIKDGGTGANLESFFQSSLTKKIHTDKIMEDHIKEIAIMGIANEIIEELFSAYLDSYLKEFLELSNNIALMIDHTVIDAICGSSSSDKDYLRVTGREYLMLGAIKDLRKKNYFDKCSNEFGTHSEYDVSISQTNCIQSNYERSSGMNYCNNVSAQSIEDWPIQTQNILKITQDLDMGLLIDDMVKRGPLMEAELNYWSKISLQSSRTSPVMLPNVPGRVELIKIFPKMYTSSSLLLAGTHLGQFVGWSVPWTGAAPLLIIVSPVLEKKNQCEIIDIREGSFNSNSIITMFKNGHIRIWDLNPVSRLGRRQGAEHMRNMFPQNQSDFVPLVPSCIFHLNPLDLTFPSKISYDDTESNSKSKKKRNISVAGSNSIGNTASNDYYEEPGWFGLGTKKTKLSPDAGTHPTTACFHPSFTFSGRNPSIMVGTEGGDIVKFNMDFRLNDLDAPIINLPPFVDVEYVQPQNAPDMILSVGKTNRKGNNVYRESFHFHKAAIVFLGVINKVSDQMLSIDIDGHVALWKYAKTEFKGLCWFEPIKTTTLDISWKSFNFVAKTRQEQQNPTEQQISRLQCKRREIIKGNKLQEFKIDSDEHSEYIKETYYPLKEIDGSFFIEFSSVVPKIDKTKKSFDEKTADDDSDLISLDSITTNSSYNMKTPEVKWQSRMVNENFHKSRMEQIVMSDDGTELFICLSSAQTNKISRKSSNAQFSEMITIVGLHIESFEFRNPYAELLLENNEIFQSFSVGPLSAETLTRVAFIHLNSCVKIFSLETGQQIITDTFPFRSNLPAFEAMLMSVCPSQRVVAFGGPKDARIDVKIFIHADDGRDDDEIDKDMLSPEVLQGLRGDVDTIRDLAVKTVLTIETPPDLVYEEAKEEANRFFEYVWNAFEMAIDRKKLYEERMQITSDIYGDNPLGIIKPTNWPLPFDVIERKDHEDFMKNFKATTMLNIEDDVPIDMDPYSTWDGVRRFSTTAVLKKENSFVSDV